MDCLICGYRDGEWARCPRCGTDLQALLGEEPLDVSPVRDA